MREGDPICDHFSVKLYENRICAVLSDSNYRGLRSKKAAKRASKNFITFLEATHQHIRHLQDASHIMLEGFNLCHHSIVNSLSEARTAGNATLLGGILFEVNRRKSIEFSAPVIKSRSPSSSDPAQPDHLSCSGMCGEGFGTNGNDSETNAADDERWRRRRHATKMIDMKDLPGWVFLCCQLGNNKALHYNAANGEVTMITPTERNPGSIGSNEGEDKPDLNGLSVIPFPCEKGDVIILMSDGCHNVFNPLIMGNAEEFGFTGAEGGPTNEEFIDSQICRQMQELLDRGSDRSRPPSVKEIVDRVMEKVMNDTAAIREARSQTFESSPSFSGRNLPHPSLGHATCIALLVSPVTVSYNEWMKK